MAVLKVNWQTRVVHSKKKIGHVNQIWATSVSPRVYIYIYNIYYIYIICSLTDSLLF